MQPTSDIRPEALDSMVRARFPTHPFADVERAGVKRLMRRYLAMSYAFPYLQAGAHQRLVFHFMERNETPPVDAEITFAVGSFLVWDELGCWERAREQSSADLRWIIDAKRSFHVHRLREDIGSIFGEDLTPDFDPATRAYLRSLFDGLSSLDPITRGAWMVSFEHHATPMIRALWSSLERAVGVSLETLSYFKTHVGNEGAAEPGNAGLMAQMIERLVPAAERGRFLDVFMQAYEAHQGWCEELARGGDAR